MSHANRPTNLGITMDRTLTFKPYPQKAAKIRSQNNLMLAGTTWGAKAKTLRSFALALCY